MTGYREVAAETAEYGVVLVAVSKMHPYSAVLEAYEDGARIFGENRVQELEAKFPSPSQRPEGMKVYLIGQLQRNKARKAVELADRIESVDSIPLAEKIEKEASAMGKTIEVLLELNSSGEEQKTGFRSEEGLLDCASIIVSSCPHIKLKGVMTVGPLGFDEERNRVAFMFTKGVFDKLKALYPSVDTLSMGMSADWKTAAQCGSTEVRIGTAIFGARA